MALKKAVLSVREDMADLATDIALRLDTSRNMVQQGADAATGAIRVNKTNKHSKASE